MTWLPWQGMPFRCGVYSADNTWQYVVWDMKQWVVAWQCFYAALLYTASVLGRIFLWFYMGRWRFHLWFMLFFHHHIILEMIKRCNEYLFRWSQFWDHGCFYCSKRHPNNALCFLCVVVVVYSDDQDDCIDLSGWTYNKCVWYMYVLSITWTKTVWNSSILDSVRIPIN